MVSAASAALYGTFAQHKPVELTSHIGTLFPESLQLSALVNGPDGDGLLRELAHLISQRNVVFFSNQNISLADQKTLGRKLGDLSGNPAESGLHMHPVSEDHPELGRDTSVITSEGGVARGTFTPNVRASTGWHSDISFEPMPADYSILKMHTLPRVGGDTLWASGYEAYDRLSPAMRNFLEGLTAYHDANFFLDIAKDEGVTIVDNRGHPANSGRNLSSVHPVIRTNPVTGYKALYVNKTFTKRIVELSPDESDTLLDYLFRQVSENHDLQVRYRWNTNDIAIWDNRCTFHTATKDYTDLRVGNRVVSIGEKPFLDVQSHSRRESLGIHF